MPVVLDAVSKTFGSVRAVVSVSARFEAGQVSVIFGANGSGKTTLLHIVGALARPTAGTVDFGEHGPGPTDVRERLGWVGHDTLCYGDLTGWENVVLAARLRGIPEELARARAQSRFGLETFGGRPVRALSRGQRQRVALARALVHDPSLVLLDEPTTGLDVAGTEALAKVVGEERARGATVVMVTHDGAFAERVGDKIYRMERGRLAPQA